MNQRHSEQAQEPRAGADGEPESGSAMTKSELIEIITAKQKHLPAKDVELALKQMLEIMSDSLAQGDRIEIRGFGSFSLHFRPPRQGRNPKTGEAVALAGKYVPHFKPGKDLRERVNQRRRSTDPRLSTGCADTHSGPAPTATPPASARNPPFSDPASACLSPALRCSSTIRASNSKWMDQWLHPDESAPSYFRWPAVAPGFCRRPRRARRKCCRSSIGR